MKQVLQHNRQRLPRIEEVPVPQLRGPGLIVSNRCSLISAGTERQMVALGRMPLIEKAMNRPDLVKEVIAKIRQEGFRSTYNKVKARLDLPTALGYSSAGIVEKVHPAISGWTVGDRVACAGYGYACHAELVYVPVNLAVKIPRNVSFEEAAFVTLGAIAMQGVRIADIQIGESVAVIGLGLLGQITCRLLMASGCRVVGLDIDKEKLRASQNAGIDFATLADDAALAAVADITGGRGVDAVIITAASPSAAPVELAGHICRDKGKIVVVGSVKLQIPRKLFYEKELELKLSRAYGPGRYDYHYEEAGRDYPYTYVRWTENRNMESFLNLVSLGKIKLGDLITHRFEIDQAGKAYELIKSGSGESYLGILLNYPDFKKQSRRFTPPCGGGTPAWHTSSNIPVGVIGAGAFATGVLLPLIKSMPVFERRLVMSGGGVSATSARKRFGFEAAVSELDDIMNNPGIRAIFITSRHDQHAELVQKSLLNGKAVFVEKPLCLNRDELESIKSAHQATDAPLMVGYNRRFAPMIQKIKEKMKSIRYPFSMHYRINAGYTPLDNWTQDSEVGGGRVIGEVCHFVDTLSYLAGSTPERVYAEALSMPDDRYYSCDNLQIVIRFSCGSVGTINYVASGNRALPKEYLEIIGGGMAVTMNDFKSLAIASDGKLQIDNKKSPDKGHRKMLELWGHCVSTGLGSPIPFEHLVTVSQTTFDILECLSSGEPRWIVP